MIVFQDDTEAVIVNRADGLAISILKDMGLKQIILTTEENKVVKARADKLGLPVIREANDKKNAVVKYCRENDIDLKNVVYVGNDINDLEAVKVVGYPICPSDAYREIKNVSKEVLETKGGFGVVRELLEKIQGMHDE